MGLPDDELAGIGDNLEEDSEEDVTDASSLAGRSSGATSSGADFMRLEEAGGTQGLRSNIVAASSVMRVGATDGRGLSMTASDYIAAEEVLFTERPQVVAAISSSQIHCSWCMRSLLPCPEGLPHAHLWPHTPRQRRCPSCQGVFCCETCHRTALECGHGRLCEARASGELAQFERCAREQCAGLATDADLFCASALLALKMMAHLVVLPAAGDDATLAGAPRVSLGPYEHLCQATGRTHVTESWAARLYPMVRVVLKLTDAETVRLSQQLLCALLCAVASNATWIQPVSSFADYVTASRSLRRREEAGETLRKLEAHCAGLREAHGERLADAHRVDQVCDEVYGVRGGGLYKLQSKINHSCTPNARLVCGFTDATIDVVALRPIARHEEVTISYINPAFDRARRRSLLQAGYGFDCECALCAQGQ